MRGSRIAEAGWKGNASGSSELCRAFLGIYTRARTQATAVSEHPHLALMRRTLDAFRSGDMPALGALLSDDVVWRVPGKSLLARDYRWQDEVFGFFGRLIELTGGTFRVESLDYFHPEHLWDAFWG